ncbi:hypothetical protein CEE36_00830 [candidate division TA06 bacterium B3_TA06]|uniref:Uncharacterized protein n=1 Tax=candidate division TA06 bacterium B3_TA06 TaxID=2012487 RepID=A0A532VAT8_UNCT6|nr:MAG: hypothetical protein CEE36_00830 [candidate division TA06 bacterium B3_TA06]
MPQDSLQAEFRSLAHEWVENAENEGWAIDAVDALVFERTIQEFGLYLEQEVGPKKRNKVFRRVNTPNDLSSALEGVLGKRFGEFFFGFYDFCERQSTAQPGWLEAESEHFIYLYHPGSAAQKDIKLIEAVAEQSFNQITDILAPDSSARLRLSHLVRTDSLPPGFSGKILLRLHPTRKDLGAFESTSGGQTGFRPIWHDDTVGYALWIDLAYPGPVGLFGIPHEVAHALALLYLSNEPLLAELLSSGEHVPANLLREAVLPEDVLRLEGWAYMVQHNHSTFVRLGLWRSTSQSMAEMTKHYDFPDAYLLLNGEMSKSFMEQTLALLGFRRAARHSEMIRYLFASADLIRFLHERYGSEKLKLFLADQSAPMDALLEVYDLTPYALEEKWKNDVLQE